MYSIRMHLLALSPIFWNWLLFTISVSTTLFLVTSSSVVLLVSLITLFPLILPLAATVIFLSLNHIMLIPWFRCSGGFIAIRIQFTLSHPSPPFFHASAACGLPPAISSPVRYPFHYATTTVTVFWASSHWRVFAFAVFPAAEAPSSHFPKPPPQKYVFA